MFLQALVLILSIIILPVCMGLISSKRGDSIKIIWVSGLLYGWVAVFIPAVICILLEEPLERVCLCSAILSVVLALAGCITKATERKKEISFQTAKEERKPLTRNEIIFLSVFIGLVLFQIYKSVFYAYADGDDAYYISVAQSAVTSGKMYIKDPYVGEPTALNLRYALAPFPIWLAILSKETGINVAIMAHVIIPPVLIIATYIIYHGISELLFNNDKEKQYMFLALMAIFMMFENVSTSTQGTFLLTRSRQGKEALANIVLPFIFFCILRIIKGNFDLDIKNWLMLASASFSAALTSLFGNILAPLLILALLIYALVTRKGFKKLVLIALMVVPNILVALCYVIF